MEIMSQEDETKKGRASREVQALGMILRKPKPREEEVPAERT